MSKKSDRLAIVKKICEVAKEVKHTLIGNSYLYIFEGQAVEVVYRARDFLHLTGVETNLRAEDFFKNAVKGKLQANQIGFSPRHAYDTCKKKMSQFHKLPTIINSELLMLKHVYTKHIVFQFGLSDLKFTVGLSEDYDRATGKRLGDYYIARSFRVEDSLKRAKDVSEVHFILTKKNTEKIYHTMTYADKRKSLADLPKCILERIDISVIKANSKDIDFIDKT